DDLAPCAKRHFRLEPIRRSIAKGTALVKPRNRPCFAYCQHSIRFRESGNIKAVQGGSVPQPGPSRLCLSEPSQGECAALVRHTPRTLTRRRLPGTRMGETG